MKRWLLPLVFLLGWQAQAATYTNSPNMNLVIPTVGQASGPDWANDINSSLDIIDAHDHTPGYGVQVPPSGLNINADLDFQGNFSTSWAGGVFSVQSGDPTPDACIYSKGVDLYYKDGNGNVIQITSGGGVNGSPGSISNLTSPASASYVSATGSFVWQQGVSTAANMDAATLVVRYPGSYPSPAGNYIAIQAPTTLATGYAVTLPATLPSANGSFWTQTTGGVLLNSTIVDNSTIQSIPSGGGQFILQVPTGGITATQIANQTITATQIANNTITRTQEAAVGQQISSSSGTGFSTSSTSYVAVTNLNATLTTTGRPVFVGMAGKNPADLANPSFCGAFSGSGPYLLKVVRDSTDVVAYQFQQTTTSTSGCPALLLLDTPSAGSHTYTVYARVTSGAVSFTVINYTLVVYEL